MPISLKQAELQQIRGGGVGIGVIVDPVGPMLAASSYVAAYVELYRWVKSWF